MDSLPESESNQKGAPKNDTASKGEWFEEWFDRAEYKLVYQHRDRDEAYKILSLIQNLVSPKTGSSILDIGCGRGRHAIVLAEAGFSVTGVDLSAGSIADARKASAAAGIDVSFEIGDMRNTFCTACFDGVVNLFTAFGYFHDVSDHQQALSAMAAAVRPGGWFLQDFLNADYVREHLVPHDSRSTDEMRIDQHRWIENGRINKRIEIHNFSTKEDSVFDESVRLFDVSDLERLHRHAGLQLHRVVGDYDGGPLTPLSPRLIIVSRKLSA